MNYSQAYKLTHQMRQYVLPVLIELYGDVCAECGEQALSYEVDHLSYRDDMTVKDLQLLCYDCHRMKTTNSGEAYLSGTSHCATCTCHT